MILPGQEFFADMFDKIPVVELSCPIPAEGVGLTRYTEHQLIYDQTYTAGMEELEPLWNIQTRLVVLR